LIAHNSRSKAVFITFKVDSEGGVKTSKQRKPKISEEKLASARDFLATHPIGQRLQAVEHALTLLLKDELPLAHQFIFNAAFNLRTIPNVRRFEGLAKPDSAFDDLIRETRCAGFVKVAMEKERLHFVLFYDRGISEAETTLFSQSLGVVAAVIYSALGLDMSGLLTIDPKSIRRTEQKA
jgi:hypothetical protein